MHLPGREATNRDSEANLEDGSFHCEATHREARSAHCSRPADCQSCVQLSRAIQTTLPRLLREGPRIDGSLIFLRYAIAHNASSGIVFPRGTGPCEAPPPLIRVPLCDGQNSPDPCRKRRT